MRTSFVVRARARDPPLSRLVGGAHQAGRGLHRRVQSVRRHRRRPAHQPDLRHAGQGNQRAGEERRRLPRPPRGGRSQRRRGGRLSGGEPDPRPAHLLHRRALRAERRHARGVGDAVPAVRHLREGGQDVPALRPADPRRQRLHPRRPQRVGDQRVQLLRQPAGVRDRLGAGHGTRSSRRCPRARSTIRTCSSAAPPRRCSPSCPSCATCWSASPGRTPAADPKRR